VGEILSSAGAILLAAVLGIPLAMYLLQDQLVFYPQRLSESHRAEIARRFPDVQQVFLDAGDGVKLHAWHVRRTPGAPLVIYFGGNAEEVSWMLGETAARASGASWLLTSYRGYGASGGKPSADAITADALQWYDYAVRELKPKQVFVLGRSLGSGAAVFLASQRKIDAMILAAPFDSLAEVGKHHYPFLPVGLLLKHNFEPAQLAPRITAPLLCLVATRDQIIPPAHARKLYEAWAGPKQWVALEDAGHNTTDSHPFFWQNIERFLQEQIH
jgi:pimeloyl-ACP methyl ester carboxylesterase